MSGRSSWIAVVAGLAILAYIGLNTLRTNGPGSSGPPAGRPLPPFAAPLVTSDLVGDANVATRPGQGAAGSRPACSITDPRALNVCTLVRRGPLVLAFLTEHADHCVAQLDTIAATCATSCASTAGASPSPRTGTAPCGDGPPEPST